MVKKHIVGMMACAVAVCALFGLSACSGTHELIGSGKSCTSCHSDAKQTYDVSSPAGAIASNGTVEVKTSASQVVVCKPTFISEDGSRFVPEQYSTASVSDGKAEVSLDEGTWVLCTVDGTAVQKSAVVVVSSTGASSAEVEL